MSEEVEKIVNKIQGSIYSFTKEEFEFHSDTILEIFKNGVKKKTPVETLEELQHFVGQLVCAEREKRVQAEQELAACKSLMRSTDEQRKWREYIEMKKELASWQLTAQEYSDNAKNIQKEYLDLEAKVKRLIKALKHEKGCEYCHNFPCNGCLDCLTDSALLEQSGE